MRRIIAILLAVGMLGILAAPVAAAKPATGGLLTNIPITNADASDLLSGDPVGVFNGTLSVTGLDFDQATGQLTVEGLLNGVVTDGTTVVQTVTNAAFETTAELLQGGSPAQCDILNLVLGPLELDLLGLVIEIPNPIVLNIFAVPGAGNLLGNLLCAVAGLLDGGLGGVGGLIDRLIDLINDLL